jgi:cytochrome c biogenesis protein CcmG/thiol:disulfide interchange protein DsbE
MKSNNLVKIVSTIVGVVIAMFFVVLVVADPSQDIVAQSPLLGQPAPAVASETIDGEQFVLERRKGSWVVLNFFNSTCVPCINEHDLLVDFADTEAANPNGAEIYTIINDDSSDAVRDFFDKNGGDWQKVKDDNGAIAVAFGVARVPETWIIDPNGLVRLRITGELSPDLLSEQVNKLRDGFTS